MAANRLTGQKIFKVLVRFPARPTVSGVTTIQPCMKSRELLRLLAFCVAAIVAPSAFAQPTILGHPEKMTARVDEALALTAQQKVQATEIFTRQLASLATLSESERFQGSIRINAAAREEIRAILTVEQRWRYDRTPQNEGGGLTMVSPETKVTRLDALVGLTPAQKLSAAKIFADELDALLAIPKEERLQKGATARQAAKAQIEALLTPEQLMKYKAAPPSEGGIGRPLKNE